MSALLASIFCVILVVSTVLVHYETLRLTSRLLPHIHFVPERAKIVIVILCTFVGHTLEVWLYGLFYYLFVDVFHMGSFGGQHIHGFFSYLYFSTVTYTSLGLGNIWPLDGVRMIAGVEALNGLILITWSASYTYLMMEKFWGQKKQ